MELSESDMAQLAMAEQGDLLVLDHGVIRVCALSAGSLDFMIMGCQVFAQCPNLATLIVDHPIMGDVPACERCEGIVS